MKSESAVYQRCMISSTLFIVAPPVDAAEGLLAALAMGMEEVLLVGVRVLVAVVSGEASGADGGTPAVRVVVLILLYLASAAEAAAAVVGAAKNEDVLLSSAAAAADALCFLPSGLVAVASTSKSAE